MKILVIDDDKNLNKGISAYLKSIGYKTDSVFNGKEAIKLCSENIYDLILSDIQMPEITGLEFLDYLNEKKIDTPIILMTAFSSIEDAVNAMKKGAADYLTKPINLNELKIKFEKVFENRTLRNENIKLKQKIKFLEVPKIIGESEAITDLKNLMKRISNDSDVPVYIYGKSGTGKELVAKSIHYMSDRSEKPFIPINCAALSDELLESELFGYVKGAFTGALNNKIGILQNCEGGTIFLDEISEMSPRVQSKILRVIQDGIVQPVGSTEMKKIDVRFISASNQELSILVGQNKFREDLFYRLNVIEIEVPSLSARKNDIPLLIEYFKIKYNCVDLIFTEEAVNTLMNYDWPGNIRELENLIRKLMVTNKGGKISTDLLPKKITKFENTTINGTNFFDEDYKTALNKIITKFDKSYLEYHLKKNNFNVSRTSEIINLSRVSLHKKIQEYSIIIP